MTFFTDSYTGNATLLYASMILNIIALIITIIWLHRAIMMRRDLIKWTNINFGFGILVLFFSSFGIYVNTGNLMAAISGNLFSIVIFSVIWITFVRHIKKSVQNNRIQLS